MGEGGGGGDKEMRRREGRDRVGRGGEEGEGGVIRITDVIHTLLRGTKDVLQGKLSTLRRSL